MINSFKYIVFISGLLFLLACTSNTKENKETPLKIWFEQPAETWNVALPVGNGSLGGMIHGHPAKEKITLNEETIWTGEKYSNKDKKDGHLYMNEIRDHLFNNQYQEAEEIILDKVLAERPPTGTNTNQMLANLFIETPGLDSVTNYRRELDLNTAIASTRFEEDGILYSREVFSSFPDQVMLVKYGADEKKSINLSVWIERTENTTIELADHTIQFSEHVGNGRGVKFHATIHLENKGGEIHVEDGKITVNDADEVIMRIVAASNYRGEYPKEFTAKRLDGALSKNYQQLYTEHIEDYRSLFKRVEFEISKELGEDMPTDVRLQKVKDNTEDHYLTQLQYQFGRYLLISSSRPGTMPANLQGLWVDGFKPPWNADYHININIQMNYWLAEMTNLSECHEPFLRFIGDLREQGRITAKETYGCGGFVAHHTTDAWHFTNCFGKPRYGMWPMGAAWCCQHLFTHYEYTEDKDYLENYAYPIMKEAARFFVDFMVTDPQSGNLVTAPSTSPENDFLSKNGVQANVCLGSAMDLQIITELFTNCVTSAQLLGLDEGFSDTLQSMLTNIKPLKVGNDGRLLEWNKEFEEPMPGHRHISHLYALHPSNQISKTKNPELFDAAKKTIEYRLANGGGHTGWSRAWIINFWARLLEPQKAYQNIIALQRKSTLDNLFNVHPPFQIDGDFGVVSGITEMLMQSHEDEIHILPALPAEWQSGHISGIVARKGFELDIVWENGMLTSLTVKSRLGNTLKLRYGDKIKIVETSRNQTLDFGYQLEQL